MKPRSITPLAPDAREPRNRPARAPQNQPSTQLHVHAGLDFHDEINDLGAEFIGGPIHTIYFDAEDEAMATLAEVYPYRVFRAKKRATEKGLEFYSLVLRFARDAMLIAKCYGSPRIIARTAEQAEAIYAEVRAVLGAAPKKDEPCFYMLRFSNGDFEADAIENLPEALDDEFLRLAYGDDIASWLDQFATKTKQRTGGLTILEGPPGTGKTSLLSEAMRRLRATHIFYVLPVSSDGALTSPELVPFWQEQNRRHPDRVKVVVLEDAERLLLTRFGDSRDAVSAVLNIADGLLGRMLKVHVACSINARLDDLDPAIQRPGRLTTYRRFTPIPRQRAVALASKQASGFQPHPEVDEFTLAEVLQPSLGIRPSVRKRIGFGNVAV